MPEGPSIVILCEELETFSGQKITAVSGNTKIDLKRLEKQKVLEFKSWGKHFLICFKGFYLRIHFLMFGTYRINEKRDFASRLSLTFKNGEINFYSCSVKLIEGDVYEDYDWETDVMSEQWNEERAVTTVKKLKKVMACDVILNQDVFSGAGNIIKNEVLYRIKVHPKSLTGNLPPKKLKELVKETRNYTLEFYEWKKAFVLRQHWICYKKKECPRCKLPYIRTYMGKTDRLTFYCKKCQKLYKAKKKILR
jgi:endonuclease VIII